MTETTLSHPQDPAAAMVRSALTGLPHKPGVYLMRDSAARIIYVGKANDLRQRVSNYFLPRGVESKITALMAEVRNIDYITAESEREALLMEHRLIQRHQPLFNTMWKDGKTYPFVKVSLNEDFPRIRLTRDRRRDGGRYFGPFPHVGSVRGLLDWVWKKRLFSLRPCDYEFDEAHPLAEAKIKSCLYFHTGECPAPCAGKIGREDYGQIAEKAVLFFEGKNAELRAGWEKDMKAAAADLDFERAARLRDNVKALDHVREPVTFRALREEDVQGRLQLTQGLAELRKGLNLSRTPFRIECFDISHVQGVETVASMVTFEGGKPAKGGYRKYIVRTVAGVDDFASMAEVVRRRYQRVKDEGLPWPDLILIDGGPGQLSAALKALRAVTSRDVPMASLAKREEEVYLPEVKKPVRFPRDSGALHVLQRIRDEAHRFAVTFHRSRRDKKMISQEDKK